MAGDQLEFGDNERSVALKRAWDRALYLLVSKVNKATFESYIRPIRPLSFVESEVTLGVSNGFAREWVEKRYSQVICSTLEALLGVPIRLKFRILTGDERAVPGTPEPEFEIPVESVSPPPSFEQTSLFHEELSRDVPARPPTPSSDSSSRLSEPAPSRRVSTSEESDALSLPISPRYHFDNFVIGKSNRLAHASAMAVANAPGAAYNPLFIYGTSGLGKTHLLHAIGNAVRARGEKRVAFVDGENFTYFYVTALRERKTEEFRRHYRNIDIWLVDDIQFIAGKEQTKEEFFHTFNALYQTGKQIVIASDRSPRELRSMDERLRSRFESGLIADVNPPELETRLAILQNKCLEEGCEVPLEVLLYIASAIQSNVRTLEGAITKLAAYSSIMSSRISSELAQTVLSEFFIDKPLPGQSRKGVAVSAILQATAEVFATSVEAIKSPRRDREASSARQVAMFLCRELTDETLQQIGAAMGGRDHTTVKRSITKVETSMPFDPALKSSVQELLRKLNN